jgi:hypothetical protein
MIDGQHPDPVERVGLTEQDLAIATLVGRYIERREAGRPPNVHDLFAVAAELATPPWTRYAPSSLVTRRCARPKTSLYDRCNPNHSRPRRPSMAGLTSPPSIRSGSLQ